MNIQQVADICAIHLFKQNKKSEHVTPEGVPRCMYRRPDGLKCAVGALIKDEFYDPDIENCLVNSDIVHDVLKKSGVYGDDSVENDSIEEMLVRFQTIHDSYTVPNWVHQIKLLYTSYHLSTDNINEYLAGNVCNTETIEVSY